MPNVNVQQGLGLLRAAAAQKRGDLPRPDSQEKTGGGQGFPNPDLENRTYFPTRHCEHLKGARQSHRKGRDCFTSFAMTILYIGIWEDSILLTKRGLSDSNLKPVALIHN
jgi:hypothetical protein